MSTLVTVVRFQRVRVHVLGKSTKFCVFRRSQRASNFCFSHFEHDNLKRDIRQKPGLQREFVLQLCPQLYQECNVCISNLHRSQISEFRFLDASSYILLEIFLSTVLLIVPLNIKRASQTLKQYLCRTSRVEKKTEPPFSNFLKQKVQEKETRKRKKKRNCITL